MVAGRTEYGPANSDVAELIAADLVKAGAIAKAGDLQSRIASSSWVLQVCSRRPRRTYALLDVWRRGTHMACVRHFAARGGERGKFLCHLLGVLRDQGFELAVSPLLDERARKPFVRMGFAERERLVVLRRGEIDIPAADWSGSIRRGEHEDAATIAQIDGQCFDEVWRFRTADICAMLPETATFVAVQDGCVIGYNMVSMSREAGTVGRLAVAPDHRRQGVGSALLAAGLSWLRDTGGKSVTLCTQSTNADSRRLYARFGFELLPDELALMQREL